MTTQRVRNHELEDFSLAALRLALPSKWVIHEFKRDYGIDVQLELFDENGMALGLRAYGQLKATDNLEDDDKLSLDRDHFDYWSSQSDPVLLLRFFSANQSFQWCWMHDVAWSMKPAAGSLAVARFLRGWDRETSAKEVATFLKQRAQVLASRLLPPFTVSVQSRTLPPDTVTGLAQRAGDLVDSKTFHILSGDQPDSAFKVFIDRASVSTSFFGTAGVVVALDGEQEDLPSLLWLLIFLTACRYDRVLVARPLAQRHFDILARAASGPLIASLAEAMSFALGLKLAVALLKPFEASDEHPLKMWKPLTFLGLFSGATLFGELAEWAELLAEAYRHVAEDERASVAYSCGNALCSLGRWDAAVAMFQAAASSDPSYLERQYFLHELAGSLFESAQYAEAEKHCRLALELSDGPQTRYLLGDALFCQGEFAAARAELLAATAAGLDESSRVHATLIAEMCAEMCDFWGLPTVVQTAPYDGSTAELEALARLEGNDFAGGLKALLAKFGSDGFFNFNAAHMCRLAQSKDLTSYRYFHCALRQRQDAEAWALGIASAFESGDAALAAAGITVGYFHCGERLTSEYLRVVSPLNMDVESRRVWQQGVIGMFHSAKQKATPSRTFRLLGNEASSVI